MSVPVVLLKYLEELDSEELEKFQWFLTQEVHSFPSIPRSRVHKKSRCDVVSCMIQFHGPEEASKRTSVILEQMKRKTLAEKLRTELHITEVSPEAETGPSQHQQTSTEAARLSAVQFVDQHESLLIQRVSCVEPIADNLKALIGKEKYNNVLSEKTTQAKMRTLMLFMTTATLKERLYQSLCLNERPLVEDLMK